MQIILIRHGKTEANLHGAWIGHTDLALCDEGERELRDYLKKKIYPQAEYVISSPLLRCRQTAGILYPRLSVQLVDGLRERNFGQFEGLTSDQIRRLPGHAGWGGTSTVFPGGEEWWNFSRRCGEAFTEQLESLKAQKDCTVATICHGGTIMALLQRFTDMADLYQGHCPCGGGFFLEWNLEQMHGRITGSLAV